MTEFEEKIVNYQHTSPAPRHMYYLRSPPKEPATEGLPQMEIARLQNLEFPVYGYNAKYHTQHDTA